MRVSNASTAIPAALLLLTLGACSDTSAGASGWPGTVDTLANGAVLVTNPAEGLWAEGEEWTITEELRIGSAMTPGPELFGNVADIDVDALGRIYVAESQANEIRVFDKDGQHIRTFGRKGAGPGEFEQIAGMAWGGDGNLWIMDTRNSRFTVYDTTGTFVTSHMRPGGFVIMPWPGGVDSAGRLYDAGMGEMTEDGFRTALVRFDSAVQPVDTFQVPEFEGEFFELVSEDGNSRMRAGVPFAPNHSWNLAPDGTIWSGITGDYRLHQISFEGDTLRIVEREFTPLPVTASDRDEAAERLSWFKEQGGKVDASKIPEVKTAFRGSFADRQGYLWVEQHVPEGTGTTYDIFDPDGRYLGQIAFPATISGEPVVQGDMVYAVVQDDELGVPYVARFRIAGRDNLPASATAP